MSNLDFLYKVADVLEAVAEEKEKLSSELDEIKSAQKKEIIAPIVEKLSFLDKNADEEELVLKLSSLDEETLSILSKAAGADVPQLGGSAKLASHAKSNNAENSFASWILS